MIVVADTSPLCYLVLIEEIDLLHQIFGKIFIPSAVNQELQADQAPTEVKNWMLTSPPWLETLSITSIADAMLSALHPGETEAILLAEQIKADLLILDEKTARKIALKRGLKITGLLGILELAATQNLIVLSTTMERLLNTNFRASPTLFKSLLDRCQS